MTRPPVMAGAAKPTVTVPAAEPPIDLVSLVYAARDVGVTPPTVRYWVETGRIRDWGRGPGSHPKRPRLVSLVEVRKYAARPTRPSGDGYPDDLISETQAADVFGCSVTKIRKQAERGEIKKWGRGGSAPNATVWVSRAEVEEVDAWCRQSLSEAAVMRMLKIRERALAVVADAEGIESREYANRRRYDRAAVNRYHRKRQRLLSMRGVTRKFGLPYWFLSHLVAQGVVPTTSGANGARLVDPVDLKPILKARVCRVCGELAPPGRELHSTCTKKTPTWRAAHSRRLEKWWQSDAAQRSREKVRELPCPNCGETFVRAESSLRNLDGQHGIFCSKACGAQYRWRRGIALERFVKGMSGRARQRWLGRWSGQLGGRPVALLDAEKAADVRRMRKTNPLLGERAIAERAGLSRRQVRAVLCAPSDS